MKRTKKSVWSKPMRLDYLSQLLYMMGLTMLMYSLTRLLFYNAHIPASTYDLATILGAFLHGLRFDLYVVLLSSSPLILLSLILGFAHQSYFKPKHLAFFFCCLNIPCMIANLCDLAYYPFTGRRTGLEVMIYLHDLMEQMDHIVLRYIWEILASTVLLSCFAWICFQVRGTTWRVSFTQSLGLSLCVLALSVIGIRGGLQKKPLSILHAYDWPHPDLAPMILNTPYMLIRVKNVAMKSYSWFKSHEEAYQVLADQGQSSGTIPSRRTEKNIVLFILESFHRDMLYAHPQYGTPAPFVAQLAHKSLFFSYAFANGRRSIDAMPSLLLGIPHLFSAGFPRTTYFNNTYTALPQILNKYGYATNFYHGAHNGSLHLDKFAKRIGFKKYHGFNEFAERYPEKVDAQSASKWGVFDDDFLNYVALDLQQKQTPFFSAIFTLSSHMPYVIPEKYAEKFNTQDYPHEFYRSVSYSDYSIQQFFEVAQKMSWYKDTLFVFSADHTSQHWSEYPTDSDLAAHHIPIFIYDPSGEIKPRVSSMVVQQSDLPATLIDYLGLMKEEKYTLLPFGRSMIDESHPGHALLAISDREYILVSDNKVTRLNKKDEGVVTTRLNHKLLHPRISQEDDASLALKLKAYVQLHNNGLLEDHMYPYPNK